MVDAVTATINLKLLQLPLQMKIDSNQMEFYSFQITLLTHIKNKCKIAVGGSTHFSIYISSNGPFLFSVSRHKLIRVVHTLPAGTYFQSHVATITCIKFQPYNKFIPLLDASILKTHTIHDIMQTLKLRPDIKKTDAA